MIRSGSMLLVLACAGCTSGDDFEPLEYDCSVFPPASSSPYVLPYGLGQVFRANPHAARETSVMRHAIDLPMPIGTDILAIRSGTVVRVEESFVDHDNEPGHENYVMVEHDDGTVARYLHLTQLGAAVGLADSVQQGDIIAHSGHTGRSTEPHLHVDVTVSCCAMGPDYKELPHGETIPLNFRNALPESGDLSCGLRHGVRYTAGP